MSDNIPEFTVTELSGRIKKTVEDAFSYVRVRGELGRVTRAGSGHVYLDLKDDRAVLSSVIWKGSASRMKIAPEQGMEVIATGRLTTFPGQSRYQLVIDTMEPAGAGALMALFEARKKALAAEGLFAEDRKQPLPFLPKTIGVVTSPSGAVIRDILHRLRDRFPSHVLVWPTLVQGEKAPDQIIAGIEGFNRLSTDGMTPRPDVLIVARGGGSLEDLWCFNDEGVARAAAASDIPLISAVGHETDTTLIDFVSDQRAPTPTAAAEMAVPVRVELVQELNNKSSRLSQVVLRHHERRQLSLTSATRGLGRPEKLLETATQRLDRASEKLTAALRTRLDRSTLQFSTAKSALSPSRLKSRLDVVSERLSVSQKLLRQAPLRRMERSTEQIGHLRLPLRQISQQMSRHQIDVSNKGGQLRRIVDDQVQRQKRDLEGKARLLESFSYKNVLERGFSLAISDGGQLIRRSDQVEEGSGAILRFADGDRSIMFGQSSETPKPAKKAKSKPTPKKKTPPADQGGLFD